MEEERKKKEAAAKAEEDKKKKLEEGWENKKDQWEQDKKDIKKKTIQNQKDAKGGDLAGPLAHVGEGAETGQEEAAVSITYTSPLYDKANYEMYIGKWSVKARRSQIPKDGE